MKHSNYLSTGTEETSKPNKLWPDIEVMPIKNWIKICETGDLKWLFITGKGRVTKKTGDHWLEIQQQYIDEFGLDESYKQQLRLLKEVVLLNYKLIETKDRSIKNVINLKKAEIEATKGETITNFYEVLDRVENYKGFAIDPEKTSVKKWYYSLKNMTKDGQANKGK